MQVIVDGLVTSYQRQGAGLPILILPGWADKSASWTQVTNDLSAKFDVIVLDLPGFGQTQHPATSWGLDEFAGFAAQFLKKVGIKQLHAVIGHSNGGAIAVKSLSSGTLEANKLVLVASAGIREKRKGLLRYKILAKTGRIALRPLPSSARQKLRRKLYDAAGSDMLVAPDMEDTFKKIISEDIREDTRKITNKTLLIYGDADESTPLGYGRLLQDSIRDSSLEVMKGAGHFVHVEQPRELSRLVLKFLS